LLQGASILSLRLANSLDQALAMIAVQLQHVANNGG